MTQPTKAEIRRILRSESAGRGYAQEVHVYEDFEDWEKNSDDHKSMWGDFIKWGRALKASELVESGRVWDIFVYQTRPYRTLLGNVTVVLPSKKGGPYRVNRYDGNGWQTVEQ